MTKNNSNVFDVASYILNKTGEITSMKLQKLVYYCQAWSLVWEEEPIFDEKIEAWANGPVVKELYHAHKEIFKIDVDKLTKVQKDTIDSVLKFYGKKSSQWLSELTHRETPWIKAREGLSSNERGNKQITIASMFEYYSNL